MKKMLSLSPKKLLSFSFASNFSFFPLPTIGEFMKKSVEEK